MAHDDGPAVVAADVAAVAVTVDVVQVEATVEVVVGVANRYGWRSAHTGWRMTTASMEMTVTSIIQHRNVGEQQRQMRR